MKKINKTIFGISFQFRINSNKKYSLKLLEELSFYGFRYGKGESIIIHMDTKKAPKIDYNNPSSHFSSENVFGMKTTFMDCYWQSDDSGVLKEVIINTKYDDLNFFYKFAHIIFGKDFTSFNNLAGKFLHELVLVPTMFFIKDYSIFHGSSLSNCRSGILLGGTGGVGKTSAIINLNKTKNFFFSDDMAVINSKGQIYHNFAYPKIYSYNTLGLKNIEKKILKNSSFLYKFCWKFFKFFKPDLIRQRIPPNFLLSTDRKMFPYLNKYVVLFKDTKKKISLETLNYEVSSRISLEIIEAEYSYFFNHLRWHDFNMRISNKKNNFDYDEIRRNILENNFNILKNVDCYCLRVPHKIRHKDYLKFIKKLIEEEL